MNLVASRLHEIVAQYILLYIETGALATNRYLSQFEWNQCIYIALGFNDLIIHPSLAAPPLEFQ